MLSKINKWIRGFFFKEMGDQTRTASFAYRIVMSTMVQRLWLLLQVNGLFLLFGFIGIFVIAEQNIEEACRDWLTTKIPKASRCVMEVQNTGEGFPPGPLGRIIEGAEGKGTRSIKLGSPGSQLYGMTYHAYIPLDSSQNKYLHITYYLGPHLVWGLNVFLLILFLELIIWLLGIFPAVRSTRKLLQPLRDMTLDAHALNLRVPSSEDTSRFSRKTLELLAGDIEQIGKRQNARLWVKDLELKGLAESINAMLDSVHASYSQQSQFVSDASHELRTPIAVIEGYAHILDRWGKDDEKTLLESITAIKTESSRLKNLVEQLLFLARGDNETIAMQWQILNIIDLVEEVYREAQIVDKKHEWLFAAETAHEEAYLRGDEGLLRQTVRILTDNTVRYSPVGGQISITISAQVESVRIAVRDQGIGIAEADIPRIFDRFFRSEASRSKKAGGTGLGLSIAKWIVEKHKGYIDVQSREGVGTCITVDLPKNWDGGFG